MNFKEINEKVYDELGQAEKEHPIWPDDPVHGAAILGEEAGEVLQAALDLYYGRGSVEQLRKELIQTAAMAIRFLAAL